MEKKIKTVNQLFWRTNVQDREERILVKSRYRTDQLSELDELCLDRLIRDLETLNDKMNKQRQRCWWGVKNLGWLNFSGNPDMERLDSFLQSRGSVKKPLEKQTTQELSRTITQLEKMR